MGVYDSVVGRCTCGEFLEWQSKAGECLMYRYSANNVLPIPMPVVEEVTGNGHRGGERKCRCGKIWKLEIETRNEYGTVKLVEVAKSAVKTDQEIIAELKNKILEADNILQRCELNPILSTLYEEWKAK
jgi:hypothetical protein